MSKPLYADIDLSDLYKFYEPEDDNSYGPVVAKRGDIYVRRSSNLFSVWAGPRMQLTTENEEVATVFMDSLRKL